MLFLKIKETFIEFDQIDENDETVGLILAVQAEDSFFYLIRKPKNSTDNQAIKFSSKVELMNYIRSEFDISAVS